MEQDQGKSAGLPRDCQKREGEMCSRREEALESLGMTEKVMEGRGVTEKGHGRKRSRIEGHRRAWNAMEGTGVKESKVTWVPQKGPERPIEALRRGLDQSAQP